MVKSRHNTNELLTKLDPPKAKGNADTNKAILETSTVQDVKATEDDIAVQLNKEVESKKKRHFISNPWKLGN